MDSALGTSVAAGLVPLLLDAALKGAAVIALAGVATWLLRRRSAALRHGIWTAAVLSQLALPLLALALPAWRVSMPWVPTWLGGSRPALQPDERHIMRLDTTTPRAVATTDVDAPATGSAPSVPRRVVQDTLPSGPDAPARRAWHPAALAWIAGVAIVLLGLVTGTLGLWRLARRGRRVHDGAWLSLTQQLADRLAISRPVTLLEGTDVGVPVTWGVVYPVVLLPPGAERWDAEQRRYVLVHEMAHVRRLDALTQLLAQVAVAAFWFDPLVWLAASRMRREREHACDDWVLREGTRASRYADDLLAMVRALGSPAHRASQPAFAALAMARPTEIEGRMLAILDPAHDRHPLRTRGALMLALTAAVVLLPLAALRPGRAEAVPAALAAAPATSSTAASTLVTMPGAAVAAPSQSAGAPTRPSIPASPSSPSSPASPASPVSGVSTRTGTYVDGTRTSSSERCDDVDLRRANGSSSTSIHVEDDAPKAFEYFTSTSGRCVEAVLRGRVEFSADERRVTRMEQGAVARFRERTTSGDRQVRFVPTADGVRTDVTVDGQPGDANDPWVGRIVSEVLREIGFDAPARVARLRAEGGTEAVLKMIEELRSGGAKRTHYDVLLESRDLGTDDVERTIRHATRTLRGSDGDLRSVLQQVPASARSSAKVQAAFGDGILAINSDGDRRSLLVQYVASDDRSVVRTALEGVRTMRSDGDKRSVLVAGAQSALGPDDATLRTAFFDAAGTIRSDGDLASVLVTAAPYARRAPAVTGAILDAMSQLRSDGDAARVLVTVAGQANTPELRGKYRAAASRLSEGDRRRALSALGERETTEPI